MRVSLAAGLLFLAACRSGEEPAPRALYELERLAFVPAAQCYLQPNPFSFNPSPWNLSIDRPIVIDLYEVTRWDLEQYGESAELRFRSREDGDAELPGRPEPGQDWPAPVSFDEAHDLAAARSMRLPTAIEWLHVAVGRRHLYFPWGQDQSSVANTEETGVGRPTAVGTFEGGKSTPYGCYDLVGNVWEWVTGAVPGYEDVEDERADLLLDARPSVMGGAFDTVRRPTYQWDRNDQIYLFHSERREPETLFPTVGARMCADAADYLWEKADQWGRGESVRERVIAVGRRWVEDPLAREGLRTLLEELLAREGAPEGLHWLSQATETD